MSRPEYSFRVFFTHTKDCFIQLPEQFIVNNPEFNEKTASESVHVFRIIGEPSKYIAWSWHTHKLGADKIGIPSTLANYLQIQEDDTIRIQQLTNVSVCEKVYVRPATVDDSEILEFNQTSIEEDLLSQVRIVHRNMSFPLYVNNNIVITLNVYQCGSDENDDNVYIINRGTEFIVETRTQFEETKTEKKFHYVKSKLEKLSNIADKIGEYGGSSVESHDDNRFVYVTEDIASEIGLENGDIVQILHLIFIRKNIVKDEAQQAAQEEPKNALEAMKEFEEKKERRVIYARAIVLNKSITDNLCYMPTIFVGKHLTWMLGAVEHATVFLRYIEDPMYPNHVHTIYMRPLWNHTLTNDDQFMPLTMDNNPSIIDSLAEWIKQRKSNSILTVPSLVFGQRNVIELPRFGKVILSINENIIIPSKSQEDEDEIPTFSEFVTKSSVENMYLLTGDEPTYNVFPIEESIRLEHRHSIYSHIPDLVEITDINEQMEMVLHRLNVEFSPQAIPYKTLLKLSPRSHCNVVISGTVGSGKTYYSKSLARHCNVYTVYISCGSIAGDRVDTLNAKLNSYAQEAMINAPSLIIFDDIETICPLEQDEVFPDINVRVAASTVVEILNALSTFSTSHEKRVNVIMTCKSLEETHSIIQNSRLFEHNLLLSVPTREQRKKIFKRFLEFVPDPSLMGQEEVFNFSMYHVSEPTLEYIVDKTENYSPVDARNILEKMINVKLQGMVERGLFHLLDSSMELTIQDFINASKDFITHSTEGIKLTKSTTSFSDIGGLQEVKNILTETFIFPTKYASLFENAPIKLRSGLLIYGPPGCGKTFLASAVAKECSLNFISIKGPELLNKYIGASEQAVRDVFMQAASAKPCIIFFDEFDSIAAQRGHDNTGVTDRVVNQFLCQLDGVESRSGVYVLAATSRPDLIDAALLRPGRLDKSVCCDIPTEQEREEILQVISHKQTNITFSEDVSFKELATLTSNYTGADLQALFFSATLIAFRDHSKQNLDVNAKKQDNLFSSSENDFFTLLNTNRSDAKKGKSSQNSASAAINDELSQQMKHIQSSLRKFANQEQETKRVDSLANIVHVTREHFMEALSTSRASLSQDDIDRYDYIYSSFRGQSDEDYINKLLNQQKRVTLA
ncbi:hypothetical protein C9374_000946 [Naegleria lovaniensis]|uniref:Peroxisomal ATPase PEX1 n=1 Tax=Naegleria lovaniensis TaxID=51637 RepID=A0AA88GTH0_NAELO|nr:Peroxin 1 (Pex1), putative [Naegleria lovaniensis]KAG2388096.1 hypothetical protein C9374_000946 [Naegleria lovaniensis]